MKRIVRWMGAGLAASLTAAAAEPVRVAVLHFEDQTGMKPDAALGGGVDPAALAGKGVFVLLEQLAAQSDLTLVDRREFIAQLEQPVPGTDTAPSYLRAAQALNAEVVVRGALQGVSTARTAVRQGGHAAEFSTLTVRVGLEALDTLDGTVIATAGGAANFKVRQTDALQTTLGEEEMYGLMEKAVAEASGRIAAALERRSEAQRARPRVRVSITTTADPALVEIDGLLVGTTPIENLEVTRGDHVLTIGRAGYRDLTKRIVFDRDVKIEVPMIRTELTADEIRDVLNQARTHLIIGEPGLTILPLIP